ncbi:MAG TPA: hypothetical protein VHX66_15770 [Solirubrobacteraceae bacterium]|jgi:hypothetical protein|nr:hypothetical protein [Solirubrobacteraceae bacterium]
MSSGAETAGHRETAPLCTVPGCGRESRVRWEIAEPLDWELGELEPFVAIVYFCDEHIGGVDAPAGA